MHIPVITWLIAAPTTQFLLLFLLGLLVAYYLYTARVHGIFKQNGIAGPKPKPFIGNAFELSNIIHQSDSRLLKQYGGEMVGYFEGAWPVLLLAEPELLRQVMVKEFANFPDRRTIIDAGRLRTGLSMATGDQWRRIRAVITPTFSSGKLRRLLPLLQHCTDSVSSDLVLTAGETVECKEYFGIFSLDVVAAAFFGVDLNVLKEPNSPYIYHAKQMFSLSVRSLMFMGGLFFPFLIPVLAKLEISAFPTASLDFFLRTIETAIQKRQLEDSDGKKVVKRRNDFLDILLASMKEDDSTANSATDALTAGGVDEDTAVFVVQDRPAGSKAAALAQHENHNGNTDSQIGTKPANNRYLSNEEIMAQAVLFLLAAYDTTSTTIAFFLNALATHPQEQDRLREEINNVYNQQQHGDDDVRDGSSLTYDQLNNLPYLDQCLQETLRVWPAATRSERFCIRETDIDGVRRIPAGAVVAIPIYYLHHNEKYWSEAEQWKPDRFSPEARSEIVPFSYLPFGQGPRNCVGMRFALLQMKVLLSTLVRRFRMLPVEGKSAVSPELDENAGLLKPKHGLYVRFEAI